MKLIQQAVITKNTSKHEIHTYIDALHNFYAFDQSSNMSHSEYLDKFKDLVEIVKQLGGDISGERQLVRKVTMSEWGIDSDYLDNNDSNTAVETCHERFLATCLITKVIGRPSVRHFIDIAERHLLPNCPINRADITAAEDIYGTNLGSLKGKTLSRNNRHVSTEVNVMPHDIMDTYHDVNIAIDIMFQCDPLIYHHLSLAEIR